MSRDSVIMAGIVVAMIGVCVYCLGYYFGRHNGLEHGKKLGQYIAIENITSDYGSEYKFECLSHGDKNNKSNILCRSLLL